MKYLQIRLLFLFLTMVLTSQAQQNHFIYIQTENRQPFYVKLDNNLLSSSASGYIVIPKLKEGAYNLGIGFPKSEWPEQSLVCTVGNKDLGFLLKNFGDKGWGLFNLQTLDIVMADNKSKPNTIAVQTKTDEFSNLLSSVVNDPTIKQQVTVKEPEKVPEPVEPKEIVETAITDTTTTSIVVDKPNIKRTLLNKSSSGTEMVYIDEADGGNDTVIVFIPKDNEQPEEKKVVGADSAGSWDSNERSPQALKEDALPVTTSITEPVQKEPARKEDKSEEKKKVEAKKEERKFIDIETSGPDVKRNEQKQENPTKSKSDPSADADESEVKTMDVPPQKSAMINSDCKNLATEADFMKLRKKMVGEDNEEDMIAAAKKQFKSKCFTVDQVKNLSVLFLKDSDRYSFFDMTYPFVSDSHNFGSLQSQITDPYYISRFQVMIRR